MNFQYLSTLFMVLFFSCGNSVDYSAYDHIITEVTIIDAEGTQSNADIYLSEGLIKKVTFGEGAKGIPTEKHIDGTGKFLIPGLWDAHVHFAYIEELAPAMFDLFLAYGVTSVRDTGGKVDFVKTWKDKANAEPKNAPRVMIAGPLLDGMPNVYDGSTPSRPELSVGAANVEDAVQIVEDLADKGVDLIKAYEMLSPEQFRAVTAAAKSRGLKVTGHVPLSMNVIQASNAGLNSMEHMRNLELSCAKNSDELLQLRHKLLEDGQQDAGGVLRSRIHSAQRMEALDQYDDEQADKVLAVLAKNDTWQIPTLSISTSFTHRPFARPDWRKSFDFLPKEVGEGWKTRSASILEREISPNQKRHTDWMHMMVGKVNDAGINIMAGTDCPIAFLTPGLSLHDELVLLVKSGMSPSQVLTSATSKPAEYFGLENLGLIKDGYIADLVLLNANPLEDIQNTREINLVIKDGKVHQPAELLEGLAN